jgi:phage tail-like protein
VPEAKILHTFARQTLFMTQSNISAHRFDPYKNFKFHIRLDGRIVAGITEVSGLHSAKSSEAKTIKRKIPGVQKFPTITLKRGISHDQDFLKWANSATTGGSSNADPKQDDFRKDISIELNDEHGNLVSSYLLNRGWVSKISAPNLNAKGNEVVIETIELEHEGVEITKC